MERKSNLKLLFTVRGSLGGFAIGAVLSAPISDRWGRRKASALAALVLVITSALSAGSVDVAMFLVEHSIGAIGAGMVMTNIPLYRSETAPPHARGFLASAHPLGIIIGLIVGSLVGLGLSFLNKAYQRRLQFVILTFWCLVVLVSIPFLPGSPRRLIKHGHDNEARSALEMLHRNKHDPEAKSAHAEFTQVKSQIELESGHPNGYLYIFRTPHLRKWAFCSIQVFTQTVGTGNVCIALLTPVIFATLGLAPTFSLVSKPFT